ncbi:MAG: tetratricopeptide repeat protein [Planctomycetota bacterium]|jgi:hypothetical protein
MIDTGRLTGRLALVLGVLLAAAATDGAAAQRLRRPRGDVVRIGLHRDAPGEAGRLRRQAFDYYYRNSNNNVFRNSRHFHPTKNAFRSSRHYRQRVAASWDGEPRRTWVRFTEHGGRRGKGRHGRRGWSRERSYSFAHHNGRYDQDFVYFTDGAYLGPDGYWEGDGYPLYDPYGVPAAYDDGQLVPLGPPAPAPPRSRRDIEQVPIHVEERPTRQAVMRQVTQPDGRVRTVITNEAAPPAGDDPWRLLRDGRHEEAAALFDEAMFDDDRGAEATLGYALALLEGGRPERAAAAARRAARIDADVLDTVALTAAERERAASLLAERPADASDEAGETDGSGPPE